MRIGIIGGGIGGLSAAYFLRRTEHEIELHEASDETGGMARSFQWHGFDCDVAPHRLYTDDEDVLNELLALVPMNRLRRTSRIHLQGRWIQDPVNAIEIMAKFLPWRSLQIGWSFLRHPDVGEDSFESMVLSKFGSGLNDLFFKPYSEKLFGIPADQISPEWGRRKLRVSGFKDMIRRNTKLYFKSFYYPVTGGYGTICDALYNAVAGQVRFQSRLLAMEPRPQGGYRCTFERTTGDQVETVEREYDVVISTLPVSQTADFIGESLDLSFRAADIYYLLVDKRQVSDNHWFYLADGKEDFCLNRVSEFRNFSKTQPDVNQTVLCCEVTATELGSEERVIEELARVGLLRPDQVLDTMKIHVPMAYPVYDLASDDEMARMAEIFAERPDLHLLGRNAQFTHRDVDEIYDEARRVVNDILITAERDAVPSVRQAAG